MRTTLKILASGLMVLALTMISCTKDSVTGDIGPIGPMGEQGVHGEKGDKGDQGEPGVDGEAQGIPGEKGDTGATGEAGPKGESGTNGTDGQDGPRGEQGATGEAGPAGPQGEPGSNGANGQDGEDGNANVRSFTYNLSSVATSSYGFDIPEVTADVLRNDVVLTYLQFSEPLLLTYQLPSKVLVGLGGGRFLNSDASVTLSVGRGRLIFREIGGTFNISDSDINAGDLSQLRIVIIESTSSETGKTAKQNVRQELKTAGIDITNYDEVARYYGLNK